MPAYSDYIVLVRDSFNILRVDETGTKSLSTETYPRPEAAAMALRQGVLHHFKPLDGDLATMVGAPYFYVNTRRMGHIWFGNKFLCGEKPIRSSAIFTHHRPDFLCVDCIQKLKHRPKLFDAVFDQETSKYQALPTEAQPNAVDPKTGRPVVKLNWESFYKHDSLSTRDKQLPKAVLLFWVEGLDACAISRRRMWPLFVRKVLDGLSIGSEVGMPPGMVKFITRVRDMEIPFERIRITVLDQFDQNDIRYEQADKVWNPLLWLAGFHPTNSEWINVRLHFNSSDCWIPKAKVDRTTIERLSMTINEWRAFFERSDWHDNLPWSVGGYEKFDLEAMPAAGMQSSDEDYVLRLGDLLTAGKIGNEYELRLVTANGKYANVHRVSSYASAYTMLLAIRRKGVVRWAYWHKIEAPEKD